MRGVVQQVGGTVLAGATVLALVACDSTSAPTSPQEPVVAARAPEQRVVAAPLSVTIRGTVVDTSNRPLARANVECLGDVQCTGPYGDVGADGHDHRVSTTDANGTYHIVATSESGDAAIGFMMNANGPGYQVEWRLVQWPGPACTSGHPGCTLTVDFRLTSVAD